MAELPAAEIARLSGIKAVNACSLAQCGLEGTALYPVYPLMNSYCYCNTMYTIHPDTKVTGTAGYLDISTQYLHSICTVDSIYNSTEKFMLIIYNLSIHNILSICAVSTSIYILHYIHSFYTAHHLQFCTVSTPYLQSIYKVST